MAFYWMWIVNHFDGVSSSNSIQWFIMVSDNISLRCVCLPETSTSMYYVLVCKSNVIGMGISYLYCNNDNNWTWKLRREEGINGNIAIQLNVLLFICFALECTSWLQCYFREFQRKLYSPSPTWLESNYSLNFAPFRYYFPSNCLK